MNVKKSRKTTVMVGVIGCLLLTLVVGTGITIGASEASRSPGTLYAKPSAAGMGDCLGWDDACTLQTALWVAAMTGDDIWVAAGTHKPGASRTDTFQLLNGVGVYGGFAGTEHSRDQRDWVANETILSGDIGTVGDGSDNSYHVTTGSGTDGTAILDGFTITGGYPDGSAPDDCGGGMYNDGGSPTLTNVTFSGNFADYGAGGGMFNAYNSSPTLTNVTFSGNHADDGGGMYNEDSSSPTLTNVTFSGNSAGTHGGGMSNEWESSPTLTNVTFSDNVAYIGGGMYNYQESVPTLTNVTFSGNFAWQGGGMYNERLYGALGPTLINVTFSGNSADSEGGGMYNERSRPELANCVLWGDIAPSGPEIYNDSSTPTINYSLVQGSGGSGPGWDASLGIDLGGNIDADPLFVDADGPDNTFGTLDDNLRLQLSSPAIDAGDNTAVPGGVTTDLGGHPRFADVASVADTGVGTAPMVDMGAYEAPPDRLCVDEDAAGSNNGTCWADAFNDLQDALTWAVEGAEIWVAEGTYEPTSGTERTDSFQLVNGVEVYGGFEGNETSRDQRDWTLHETILSGDIGTAGDDSDNSYHVVSGSGTDAAAMLDGFTITGGNGNGGGFVDRRGGGMYNDSGSPTLTNVSFSGNDALLGGGGMANYLHSGPTLTNVTFSDNSAGDGGGMCNEVDCSPTLTNVTFSANCAEEGGGMYNYWGSSPTLTNVTFSANSALWYGGGMYNWDQSQPTLANCIVWGNTAFIDGAQIYNDSSTPTISYSLVQDCGGSGPGWDSTLGTDGDGNIDADPLFVDADGPDDIFGTLDDNLRLRAWSPAIDAADNSALPADTLDLDEDGDTLEPLPIDLDRNPRFVDLPSVPDTGVGSPPIVDMGAYETLRYLIFPLVFKGYAP